MSVGYKKSDPADKRRKSQFIVERLLKNMDIKNYVSQREENVKSCKLHSRNTMQGMSLKKTASDYAGRSSTYCPAEIDICGFPEKLND